MAVHHCGDETQHPAHDWERGHCVGTTAEGAALARAHRHPRGRYAQVGLPEIVWGETLCWSHCGELAVLAFDGYPYCLAHGDDALEQVLAREIDPATADLLLEAKG